MIKSLLKKIAIFLSITVVVFAAAIPLFILLTGNYQDASKQVIEHLDIQASVTEKGDMTVTETWKINFKNRDRAYRNIYKTFQNDSSKFDSLTNLSVYDIDYGINYPLQKVVNPENAPANLQNICYSTQTDDTIEIGLFMPRIYEGTRNFQIQYTFENCMTAYTDTAVLYYQFIGPHFSLPITNMNVNITLPRNKNLTQNPYAWLHCTANSHLTIHSPHQISFTAKEIPAKTMAEVRIAAPLAQFPGVTRTDIQTNLQTIQNEESLWATEYYNELEYQYILGILDIIFAVVIIAASVILFVLIQIFTRRYRVEVSEYTRQIPEGYSPAGAALLYYHYKGGISQKQRGKVFSATLMSLSNKGYLEFRTNNQDTLLLTPIGNTQNKGLTLSEEIMLSLITTVATSVNGSFTLKQFTEYTKKHGKYVNTMFETFLTRAKEEILPQNYYEKKHSIVHISRILSIGSIIAGILTLFFSSMIYIAIAAILAGIFTLITNTGPTRLSVKGETDYMTWKGLEKYMLDFSNLKEYELPHLELWKDYLVYATMMGISDKVCNQLKLAYPSVDDDIYMSSAFGNSYFYWMFMSHYHHAGFHNRNFASGLGNKLNSINAAAIRIANPPSSKNSGGGFGGGGFSGGGGGFGGGGGGVR